MVSEYFGLPGSGKSSYLVYKCIKIQSEIFRGKSPYDRVVTNVDIDYPGIVCLTFREMMDIDLGWNTYIAIDEATLEFDSRDYKSFDACMKDFFLQHRRYKYDCDLFLQQWDGYDKKIRVITDHVYYVHRGSLFKSITYLNEIPYGIMIPKKKENESAAYGEIVQGYHRGSLIQRMSSRRFYRPLVYGYYNSYIHPQGKKSLAVELLKRGWSMSDIELVFPGSDQKTNSP